MSDHDPFDGIYDSAPPAAAVEAERQKPDDKDDEPQDDGDSAGVNRSEPQDAPKGTKSGYDETNYSIPFLRGKSKHDLADIASGKGLDASGSKEQLVSRITAAQNK